MTRSTEKEDEVFFTDGVVVGADSIALSAGFSESPDAAASRIYFKLDGRWVSKTFDSDFIVSLAYCEGRLYAAGRNGLIVHVGKHGLPFILENIKGKVQQYELTEAANRGHLSRVKAVGGEFLACGWGGQMYRLFEQKWEKMENGIDQGKENDLLDVDGNFPSDIYAVGLNGLLMHYDGIHWTYLDSPTNNHFYSVFYVSKSEVYLAGREGGLYRGNKNQWDFIGDKEIRANFWSAAMHGGKVYVAHGDKGLFQHEGGAMAEVKFNLDHQPYTHRLSAGSGKLLSTGSQDLLLFDGSKWDAIICPDNE